MASQSHSAPSLDLAQHFLIAMPGMQDDAFAHSVVYVCEHNARGALGLCINKPGEMVLDELFEQLQLPLQRADLRGARTGWGGPVQTERGFILHPRMEDPDTRLSPYASSLSMPDGLQMTTSKDILEDFSRGAGPQQLVMVLGYCAWEAGQLEDEVRHNSWLTVPADHAIVFDAPLEQRYARAMHLLGIAPGSLSSACGSA